MEHSDVLEHPCWDDEQLQEASRGRFFPHQCCGSITISLGLQRTEVEWEPCTEEKNLQTTALHTIKSQRRTEPGFNKVQNSKPK